MNLKEDLICNICKKFLHDPIYLPCHCYVCNDHTSDKGNQIKCLNCNDEFPKSKRFKSNELAKKFIDTDSHLNEEQKLAKQMVKRILLDFDALLEEFNSNQATFEIDIIKQFEEIRNKIDLQREELKKKIDEIALEMIDQAKEKEKTLLDDLNRAHSNLINNGLDAEVKILLEEFRNPNMVIDNIKSSIEQQEATINQLKKSVAYFKVRVDKTKAFYFRPNLNNNNSIFGDLNLNEVCHKLISCSADKTIKIWDLETFECLKTINAHNDTIYGVEKVTNNCFLSCSLDKTIKIWDVDAGLCLKKFNGGSVVTTLRKVSDNCFASGSKKEIKIWNIADGRCVKTLNGHDDYVRELILLPNGSLVSCSQDKTIKAWNIDQGTCTKTLNGHTGEIYCLLLLNNGNLVSGSKDKSIKIWNLESYTCVTTLNGHNHSVGSLALKQNGELISSSEDKTIKIWNLETCTCIKTLNGHTKGIAYIQIYQDNMLISCAGDQTIKIWNLETSECIRTLDGHAGVVRCLSIV